MLIMFFSQIWESACFFPDAVPVSQWQVGNRSDNVFKLSFRKCGVSYTLSKLSLVDEMSQFRRNSPKSWRSTIRMVKKRWRTKKTKTNTMERHILPLLRNNILFWWLRTWIIEKHTLFIPEWWSLNVDRKFIFSINTCFPWWRFSIIIYDTCNDSQTTTFFFVWVSWHLW